MTRPANECAAAGKLRSLGAQFTMPTSATLLGEVAACGVYSDTQTFISVCLQAAWIFLIADYGLYLRTPVASPVCWIQTGSCAEQKICT